MGLQLQHMLSVYDNVMNVTDGCWGAWCVCHLGNQQLPDVVHHHLGTPQTHHQDTEGGGRGQCKNLFPYCRNTFVLMHLVNVCAIS